MGVQFKKALVVYRDVTVKLIEELERENYDALEDLLCQRQIQIDEIDKIEHSKEEFTAVCKELKILSFQERLTRLMNIKRANVRDELDNFSKGKTANISYRNKGSIDAFYFNKKI